MEYSYDSMGNPIEQAATFEERVAMARMTIDDANLTTLVLVDEIENPVWCSYGQMPNNAYLIGQDGLVVTYQKWNDPQAMEAALLDHLSNLRRNLISQRVKKLQVNLAFLSRLLHR